MKKIFTLAIATGLLIVAQNGFAGDDGPANLDYEITIAPGCTVDATSAGMNFGIHDATYDLSDVAAGSVDVTCPVGRNFVILFDAGDNEGGTGSRRMSDGTNFIIYTLKNDTTSAEVGDNGPYPSGFAYTMTYNQPGIADTAAVATSVPYLLVADVTATGASVGTYTDQVRATVAW